MSSRYYRSCIVPAVMAAFLVSSCAPFMVRNYSGGADSQPVKILVLKTSGSVTLSSRSAFSINRNAVPQSASDSMNTSCTLNPGSVNGSITVNPGHDPLMVNGQAYRGSFMIRSHNHVLQVINILTVDEYLLSVVPGEIPANWEKDSLMAQAIAARTFTYYHLYATHDKNKSYDLDATAATQVYRGVADEKPQTTGAVRETSGQVMVYGAKPILSYFHSTCGGKTIDDRYVWEKSHLPYLKGTTCGFCNDSTKFSWKSILNLAEIRAGLSKKHSDLGTIRTISFKKKDDRVVEVLIHHSRGTIRMNGNNFRLMFPPEKIRSLYFTSKNENNCLVLTGHGWGHGVGLCQWGARGMALRGYGYKDILRHYYLGVKITDIGNSYIASKDKNSINCQ